MRVVCCQRWGSNLDPITGFKKLQKKERTTMLDFFRKSPKRFPKGASDWTVVESIFRHGFGPRSLSTGAPFDAKRCETYAPKTKNTCCHVGSCSDAVRIGVGSPSGFSDTGYTKPRVVILEHAKTRREHTNNSYYFQLLSPYGNKNCMFPHVFVLGRCEHTRATIFGIYIVRVGVK